LEAVELVLLNVTTDLEAIAKDGRARAAHECRWLSGFRRFGLPQRPAEHFTQNLSENVPAWRLWLAAGLRRTGLARDVDLIRANGVQPFYYLRPLLKNMELDADGCAVHMQERRREGSAWHPQRSSDGSIAACFTPSARQAGIAAST
jgi:hypothetical protein